MVNYDISFDFMKALRETPFYLSPELWKIYISSRYIFFGINDIGIASRIIIATKIKLISVSSINWNIKSIISDSELNFKREIDKIKHLLL